MKYSRLAFIILKAVLKEQSRSCDFNPVWKGQCRHIDQVLCTCDRVGTGEKSTLAD